MEISAELLCNALIKCSSLHPVQWFKKKLTTTYIIFKFSAPYFPRCKRFDPKLSECLIKATETVKPYLVKGVPELGIPAIEPYVIPEITLEQGTQALNFKALLKNVVVKGLGAYKFSQFE